LGIGRKRTRKKGNGKSKQAHKLNKQWGAINGLRGSRSKTGTRTWKRKIKVSHTPLPKRTKGKLLFLPSN